MFASLKKIQILLKIYIHLSYINTVDHRVPTLKADKSYIHQKRMNTVLLNLDDLKTFVFLFILSIDSLIY
jgi:hypothetical protein